MKFGKVLTYRDVDEAKKLVGKNVVCSDYLKNIEDEKWCSCEIVLQLEKVDDFDIPFIFHNGTRYQFIREVLPAKPEYEPYDLSDPAVRKSLRDRWIIWNDGDEDDADEAVVIGFVKREGDPWEVKTSIGGIDAAELVKFYVFDDGKPCGQLVYTGAGHMECNASERKVSND